MRRRTIKITPRADPMIAKRKSQGSRKTAKKATKKTSKASRQSSRRAPKDALQFAPNFTVYVLPDHVVCLYSEDRKFFLHGELYVALAQAIGEKGKSARQLAGELGAKFPADQVDEAIKRLIERRYVVTASKSFAAPVAGYWASLGLPPQAASEALKTCRVRVEAFDVEGAKE